MKRKFNTGLLISHLKISIRSLVRQKVFSLLNISGLAIGLAAVILMTLFVLNELRYDHHLEDVDEIYRVTLNDRGANTPSRLAWAMKEEIAGVEVTGRMNGSLTLTILKDNNPIRQEGVFFADSTVFQLFGWKLTSGKESSALTDPTSVVLTKSIANKYFPETDAMGKNLNIDGEDYIITGIMEDPPKTTHLPFKLLVAYPQLDYITNGYWTGNSFYTYVKLEKGKKSSEIEESLVKLTEKYVGPEILDFTDFKSFDEYKSSGNRHEFKLAPVADIHLEYPFLSRGATGSKENLYTFSSIAIFILLLACINFVNLSTARAITRSKEIGVRKVMGSFKSGIRNQYLTEALLISFISLILALLLASVFVDIFGIITGREFTLTDLFQWQWLLIYFSISLVTGLLAGIYPSLVMSGFSPIVALKKDNGSGNSGGTLRRVLVGFQFSFTILIMVATIIVYEQLSFMKNANPGINTEQTFVVKGVAKLSNKEAFENQLAELNGVLSFSHSNSYPSQNYSNWSYQTLGQDMERYSPDHVFVDYRFMDTYELELLKGRFFNKELALDSTAIVINQTFADQLYGGDVIGKQLSRGEGKNFEIIGVVKDFNSSSMSQKVRPLLLRNNLTEINEDFGSPYLSIRTDRPREILDELSDLWYASVDNYPFEYVFIDESYRNLYESEERYATSFSVFSIVSLIVGLMGLVGLTIYTLQRLLKSLMIRKVLGADKWNLSKGIAVNFGSLLLIGIVIGGPTGYLIMDKWLSNFAYQVEIGLWPLIIPSLILTISCSLIILGSLFKLMRTNPVDLLRVDS